MEKYMTINIISDDLWKSEDNLVKVINMVDDNTSVKITFGRMTSETEIMHNVLSRVGHEKLNYRLELVNGQYDLKSVAIIIYKVGK